MNINELEELAKAATPGPWVANEGSVRTVSGDDSTRGRARWQGVFRPNDASYIAASNPSAILELIAAYREAVAAIDRIENELDVPTWFDNMLDSIHVTAKRLGVE